MPNVTNQDTTLWTAQNIQNLSFDPDFNVLTIEMLGFDLANNVIRRMSVTSGGLLKVTV